MTEIPKARRGSPPATGDRFTLTVCSTVQTGASVPRRIALTHGAQSRWNLLATAFQPRYRSPGVAISRSAMTRLTYRSLGERYANCTDPGTGRGRPDQQQMPQSQPPSQQSSVVRMDLTSLPSAPVSAGGAARARTCDRYDTEKPVAAPADERSQSPLPRCPRNLRVAGRGEQLQCERHRRVSRCGESDDRSSQY